MKIHSTINTAVLVVLVATMSGCSGDANQSKRPESTNAVSSPSRFHSPEGEAADIKTMQMTLTTELSRNQKIIPLGKGLFFFSDTGDETLNVIGAYIREHTNLVPVAIFPAADNYANAWYSGGTEVVNLRFWPSNLNVSNGTFVVFRDK